MHWKYILLVVILAVIVGGGIFGYQYWWLPKQKVGIPEIEIPEEKMQGEVEVPTDWKTYQTETYKVKYPKNWEVVFEEEKSGGVMFGEKGTEYFLTIHVDSMQYSSLEEVVKNWKKDFEEDVQKGLLDISEEKINLNGNTG